MLYSPCFRASTANFEDIQAEVDRINSDLALVDKKVQQVYIVGGAHPCSGDGASGDGASGTLHASLSHCRDY